MYFAKNVLFPRQMRELRFRDSWKKGRGFPKAGLPGFWVETLGGATAAHQRPRPPSSLGSKLSLYIQGALLKTRCSRPRPQSSGTEVDAENCGASLSRGHFRAEWLISLEPWFEVMRVTLRGPSGERDAGGGLTEVPGPALWIIPSNPHLRPTRKPTWSLSLATWRNWGAARLTALSSAILPVGSKARPGTWAV